MGFLVDCKGEAGVLSGEAGLEGISEGGEIWEKNVTTGFVGMSKPEGTKGWKSSSGSERNWEAIVTGKKDWVYCGLEKELEQLERREIGVTAWLNGAGHIRG